MKGNIFIKRPAMAISISVMLLIVGVISLVGLPVEQYPDIAPPTVQVSATYTGASAEAVQKSVVVPLEESINGVADVLFLGNVYSLRIWLKPDVMAQYGLVPSDITSVLDEQNIESPTGAFGENSDNTFQYTMIYKGRLSEVTEFENMVIRSLPDDNVLRVKDVTRKYQLQDAGKIQPDEQVRASSGCESGNSCVSSQQTSDTFFVR